MQAQTNQSNWTRRRRSQVTATGMALALLIIALLWSAWRRSGERNASGEAPMARMSGMASPAETDSPDQVTNNSRDLQIDLAADDLKKVRIRTVRVNTSATAVTLRTPGIVKADEYQEVHVTPLAGGIVKQVPVILGDHVRRGQALALLFSSELADAETRYVSDLAELEAEHKKLDRTRNLLKLGAVSQQEEEEVTAAHAVHDGHVRSAREKLKLLGVSERQISALQNAEQIDASLVVPAPIDGVVLMRAANLGLVATTSQELFTIADLSTVWVMASVNEKDFASVHVGSQAKVTAPAYPGRTWKGRVVYIQPQVDPTTRTAQARIEVANLDERLRIEMYADVDFASEGPRSLLIPKAALQAIGAGSFVFLPIKGNEGSFTLRQVKLGSSTEGQSQVLNGVNAGDEVVTDGSFVLRAEAVRQHPELH